MRLFSRSWTYVADCQNVRPKRPKGGATALQGALTTQLLAQDFRAC